MRRFTLVFVSLFLLGVLLADQEAWGEAAGVTFHDVAFAPQEVDEHDADNLTALSNWIFAPGNWADGSSVTVVSANSTVTTTLSADVLFAFDKSDLSTDAQSRLVDVARQIGTKGAKQVAIDGYTDSVGDDAYNVDLSQRRGEAVRNALTNHLPDVTFTVKGHGSANPVAANDNDANRAKNRRVTLTY